MWDSYCRNCRSLFNDIDVNGTKGGWRVCIERIGSWCMGEPECNKGRDRVRED